MKTIHQSQIPISKAIAGYLLAAEARHLSKNTLRDYSRTFQKFLNFLGDDLPLSRITSKDIEAFLRSETVSKKTILTLGGKGFSTKKKHVLRWIPPL